MVTSYNQVAARSLERIAALGDGVFAIAMTLIVFGIRVPDPGPVQSEQELWNAQQTGLLYFARADRDLSWLQLGFLATVALMPFSAALLSEFFSFRIAPLADWANIALLGLLLYAAWSYALLRSALNFAIAPRAPWLSRS
ncbi:MAG TPA: hypothetical protein DCK98_10595 [Chloroflexi bacterium]|nr:hypothetical protein [Chloroflexota bacterium]HAL26275.1 hypothetical protein [Chloroflexota bacterium]